MPLRRLVRSSLPLLFFVCSGPAFAQPDDSSSLQQYSQAAQAALASGNFQEAEADYRKLLQLRPDLAELHVTLGALYFQTRRYGQAISELRTALKLKPTLPRVEPILSMSLAELGHYGEALPGLEKGFHQSADPQLKRMCGLQLLRAFTRLQQNDKAIATALQLDQLYPADAEVLYHTGQVYGNLAFLNMRKLATVAPDSPWRHMAAGEAYESQGAYLQAINEYHQVLSIDSRRPNVHYRLGRTLLARAEATSSVADTAEALQEFQRELEIDPENANAAYEIAEVHRRANQLQEARRYFETALSNYPDFEDAQVGLAATLMALQEPRLALPHLQKAVSLQPRDEVAWYRLSQADRALGDAAGQKIAIAEFLKLKRGSAGRNSSDLLASPSEVSPQRLDSDAPQ